MTRDDVTDALRAVRDPETGFDIINLGLVLDVQADPDRILWVLPAAPATRPVCSNPAAGAERAIHGALAAGPPHRTFPPVPPGILQDGSMSRGA